MAYADQYEPTQPVTTTTTASTDPWAVATGGNTDPFYQSTGTYKWVTMPDGSKVYALDVGSTKPPAAGGIGSISPATGLVITGTDRNSYWEKKAMQIGYTPEYIASRGGINAVGYFNDTPLNGQLTMDEYRSVIKPDGTVDTQKMLSLLNAKGGSGNILMSGGTGGGGGGSGGSIGGYDANGNPTPGGMYNAQGQFVGSAATTPQEMANRVSAYSLLYDQFNQYGLGALVEPLKNLIMNGMPAAEFTLRLRETDAYKKRFAANQARINNGLRALSEAEYIGMEDAYQDVMRRYGLPASYYSRGDMGIQQGFEKFIAGDVSATELEDRIATAQNRVINAAPEISATLRQYYPDISNGDILAYVLDPSNAIQNIKRKVTAAEIGGAATMAGLSTGMTRAEELARYGVTADQARQGFQTVAEVTPRGGMLADIYKQSPYTQATAEAEVFGLGGATEAAKQRKKLTQLEQASFSGASGMAGGALARDRAGSF